MFTLLYRALTTSKSTACIVTVTVVRKYFKNCFVFVMKCIKWSEDCMYVFVILSVSFLKLIVKSLINLV